MDDISYTASSAAKSTAVRIVGIGASAGGLEALKEVLETLPVNEAIAYVIAQHVSPTHISLLMGLLSPSTLLKVEDLTDKCVPEGGHIYNAAK